MASFKDDILILQNEINNIRYIIDAAYKKGMFIILNPSPINDDISEIDFMYVLNSFQNINKEVYR